MLEKVVDQWGKRAGGAEILNEMIVEAGLKLFESSRSVLRSLKSL